MKTLTVWARIQWKFLVAPGLAILTGTGLVAFEKLVSFFSPSQLPFASLLGLQLLFSIVLMLAIPSSYRADAPYSDATRVANKFRLAWRLVWFYWAIFYLGMLLIHVVEKRDFFPIDYRWVLRVAENALNNLTTAAILCAGLVLYRPTSAMKADSPWLLVIILMITFTALDSSMNWYVYGSAKGTESFPGTVPMWMRTLSGFAAGIVMALFVGNLTSSYIRLPWWVAPILFTYAVIQAAWPLFPDREEIRHVLVGVSLGLKGILFVVVAWMIDTGVLVLFVHSRMFLEGDKGLEEYERYLGQLEASRVQKD